MGSEVVKSIHFLEESELVYNLEVANTHNYYISNRLILVHNETEKQQIAKIDCGGQDKNNLIAQIQAVSDAQIWEAGTWLTREINILAHYSKHVLIQKDIEAKDIADYITQSVDKFKKAKENPTIKAAPWPDYLKPLIGTEAANYSAYKVPFGKYIIGVRARSSEGFRDNNAKIFSFYRK